MDKSVLPIEMAIIAILTALSVVICIVPVLKAERKFRFWPLFAVTGFLALFATVAECVLIYHYFS